MSNLAKIYSDACGGIIKETPENKQFIDSITESELSKQAKFDWLQNPVTAEIFKSLNNEIEDLEKQARELACGYAEHNNHQRIINLLVRSSELRKIQLKYGRN